MRGEQDRRAAAGLIALQVAADPVRGVRIERGGGFVQEQHFRCVDQRLGERDPGPLAGRKMAAALFQDLGQLQLLGKRPHPARRVRHAVEPGEEAQVLLHRQAPRQIDVGRGEVDPAEHAVPVPDHVLAQHRHRAATWQKQAEEHGYGRGLACPVGAQKRRGLAAGEREANVLDRGQAVEDFGQGVDLDNVLRHPLDMTPIVPGDQGRCAPRRAGAFQIQRRVAARCRVIASASVSMESWRLTSRRSQSSIR